ncbi:MAG TPA: EAL domain-containing protein [candidate division Zixibacteria bacterium]|nr:EAL domain-containing protein [candidate division Zixibacteria bacterium]
MDDAARGNARAQTPSEARVRLGVRLALVLGACALAGIVAERLLADLILSAPVRGLVSAVLASLGVGTAAFRLVVTPMARSREELTEAYHEALASALEDQLTGLGNHRAFQEELERQVEAAQRYEVPLSLVLIDLDEFKAVNDRAGHAAGDRTLARFGRLVSTAVRRPDRPFRVGGDEFAILLPHTDAEGARIVARRLLATALAPPLRDADGPNDPISFSAGIAELPGTADSRAQLYSQADAALYAAKRVGRTEVVVFDPAQEPAMQPSGAGAALAEVIARGQLRPAYQPIVELRTRLVLGMEGLIRPVEPAPFTDPGTLFAAAEASGHLVALDLSCVETIVAGATGLDPDLFLSVNLSPATVEAPEFGAAALLSILARHGFPPDRLVIELTERQPISDPARVRAKLQACRAAGIRFAADDVGAGNAGLRLLSELAFDMVKVDLSLVQRSASSESSSAVVESVVSFAARTGAVVIGEGIEHPEQVDQLTGLGVRLGQGFLLGRPAPLPGPVATRPGPMATTRRPIPASETVGSGMAAWRQSIGLPVS